MLQDDHQRVKELFCKFDATSDWSSKTRQKFVEEVCTELEIYTRIEEEICCPAVDTAAGKQGDKLIDESVEKHRVGKHWAAPKSLIYQRQVSK
jgi:hypothetical protein